MDSGDESLTGLLEGRSSVCRFFSVFTIALPSVSYGPTEPPTELSTEPLEGPLGAMPEGAAANSIWRSQTRTERNAIRAPTTALLMK